MKDFIVFAPLVALLSSCILFICQYSTRYKEDLSRKRSFAIGIFIGLIVNSFCCSYLGMDKFEFIPLYAVLVIEIAAVFFFSLAWFLYSLVVKKQRLPTMAFKKERKVKEEMAD